MSIRLSEAIRLGAMLRPKQITGGYLTEDGSCALGAAADAIGLKQPEMFVFTLTVRFPILKQVRPCPRGCGEWSSLEVGIVHLNDHCCHQWQEGWTREKIADWVEGVERELGMWSAPAEEVVTVTYPLALVESVV